eukprot:14328767-Alexandrium_andersonii.AAC.1
MLPEEVLGLVAGTQRVAIDEAQARRTAQARELARLSAALGNNLGGAWRPGSGATLAAGGLGPGA